MVEGIGLGLNARAAVITRGLAEITRLGIAMGADPLTFAGLSGLGDLVLTCTGGLSRNLSAGRELGAGRSIEEIQGGTRMVIEGVSTTRAAHALAARYGAEMPLTEEMYQVLFAGKSPRDVVQSVLRRSFRPEIEYTSPIAARGGPLQAGEAPRG
jgi:glycerol-3-phosphate dehydrogenase (NAD(P)+)